MALTKLIDYLDEQEIDYRLLDHPIRYTAEATAKAAHVDASEFAKTVVVRIDGAPALAVTRGQDKVDLERLREAAGAAHVELASEWDFDELFPGVHKGAMPPFGNLFDLPVFVDRKLTDDETLYFNAGTHSQVMALAYDDFQRLVEPSVVSFAQTH